MKKKTRKPIPTFRTAAEEHAFWQTHDTTEYVDYGKGRVGITFDAAVEEPVKMISIRLPRDLLNKIRALATKMDVPYQSLIKMILSEKVGQVAR